MKNRQAFDACYLQQNNGDVTSVQRLRTGAYRKMATSFSWKLWQEAWQASRKQALKDAADDIKYAAEHTNQKMVSLRLKHAYQMIEELRDGQ